MGHAEHFLERLDRLSQQDVEVALSLYRDHELVRALLSEITLPETATRVAISLGDPKLGPFIVVTRRGHFVTCLGEGMRVSNHPVVTREQFDAVTRRVERVRDLVAEVRKHPAQQVEGMLASVMKDGSSVSREQFVGVAAWTPLIAHGLFNAYARIAADTVPVYLKLARRQTFKRRDEAALHRYWQNAWALGHLSLLLGVDGGRLVRRACADLGDTLTQELTWATVQLGVTSLAARGVWLAGRVGKPLVATYKRMYDEPGHPLQVLNAGMSLTVIALRHKRLRAEIGKALAPSQAAIDDPELRAVNGIHEFFAWAFDKAIEQPDAFAESLEDLNLLELLAEEEPDRDDVPEERLPTDVQAAAILQTPFPLIADPPDGLLLFAMELPWIARASPEAFYLPEEYMAPEPWTPELSIDLMEARQRVDRSFIPDAATTVRTDKQPGRNDPCPCGSGKKFKRCCLAAS